MKIYNIWFVWLIKSKTFISLNYFNNDLKYQKYNSKFNKYYYNTMMSKNTSSYYINIFIIYNLKFYNSNHNQYNSNLKKLQILLTKQII